MVRGDKSGYGRKVLGIADTVFPVYSVGHRFMPWVVTLELLKELSSPAKTTEALADWQVDI